MRLIAVFLSTWALAAALHAAQSTAEAGSERRAAQLAAQLRCLVCQNQSIAESNADLAVDLRRRIDEQIASGASDAEIIEFMVARYGDFVLYRPPVKAETYLLWFGPPLILVLSFVALFRYLRMRASRLKRAQWAEEDRMAAIRLLNGNSDDHA